MELTSQAINEAEFSMAKRGYDPDQVDEFLEKLAVAVDKQNEALGEARERAAMAERRAAEAERRLAERPERPLSVAAPAAPAPAPQRVGPSPAEVTAAAEAELETLKRTLVLAQKTADATVREAEDEAKRMIATAERDAEAAEASTRARLLAEIATLDSGRNVLQADLVLLERHLEEQRLRLRSSVADLQRLLDDPGRLKPAPVPSLADVDLPATAPAAETEPADAPVAADPFMDAAPAEAAQPHDGIADGDDAWARFGTADAPGDLTDDDADDLGPPTQPVLRLDDLTPPPPPPESGDAYLDELRKAMLDDTGAPVDEGFDDERGARSRFGRRR